MSGWSPELIRNLIRDNYQYLHDTFGVTGIEKDTGSWTHIDFRPTCVDELLEITYN